QNSPPQRRTQPRPDARLVPPKQQPNPGCPQPGFLGHPPEQSQIPLPLRFVFLIDQHPRIKLKEATAELPNRFTDLKQLFVSSDLTRHRLAMVPNLDRGARNR